MITYEELNEQNHRITELSNVLHYLFKDRSMCDTGSCCELFYRYVDLVKEHVELVDKEMYKDLLASPDDKVTNVAKNFMSGSVEVRKILREFTHRWCPASKKKTLCTSRIMLNSCKIRTSCLKSYCSVSRMRPSTCIHWCAV